jgi:hypothetical protein
LVKIIWLEDAAKIIKDKAYLGARRFLYERFEGDAKAA